MKSIITRSLVMILFAVSTLSFAYALPDLGNSSYASLPASEEKELSVLFMKDVRESVPIIQDPIINNYINSLGKKLVSNSTAQQKQFHFFIIDSGDINAFAGPGAHIGINSGTILLAKNEDELAGVLAHEITHVSQHHFARAIEKARGSTVTALATIAAALIVGTATHQGDAAMGGLMAAQTLSLENQLGYSRDNEREADRIGIQVLHKSQFDPQAMPKFLSRMSKQQIDILDGRFSYLRTHPVNEERIADAKARADELSPIHHEPSLNFKLMQMRLLALSGSYNPAKFKIFSLNALKANSPDYLAKQYGKGILLFRGRKLTEAENILRSLHQQHPQNSLFSIALADIYREQQHLSTAEQLLEKSYNLDRDFSPLVLNYAEILMQQNHSQKALQLLTNFTQEQSRNNVDILEALAQAQAKNGLTSRAYLTRARIYQITDQPKRARLQSQQALKYASDSEKAYIKNELMLNPQYPK
ncbi:MAG: M48 family metalloprotease [Gammaproteobacteria bacterium]|nr:M48 family metalloprotease [Gammaproteobacteria bacterium]